MLSGDTELLQSASHLLLGLARAVNLSGVEEVDASFPSTFDHVEHGLIGLWIIGVQPIAETKARYLESGSSEVSEFNLGLLGFHLLVF